MYLKNLELSRLFFKVVPNSMSMVRCHIKRVSDSSFSFSKYRILANVKRGITTVSEIAELHGVSQPAISKLVNSLVEEGYLSRHESLLDRRVTMLKLTKEGTKQFQKIKNEASKNFESKFDVLNKSELAELNRALQCLDNFFDKVQESR